MSPYRIAVIDVETTGLSPWRHDRIVEIAVVIQTSDGAVVSEYETLINPGRDIGPSRLHRISAAEVLHAPSFADIAGDLLSLLASVDIIAGHNVSFDKAFLIKEFERVGVELPQIPVVCTCQLFGRNSLQACCDELEITFEGAPHTAISDARATSRLVSVLSHADPAILAENRIVDVSWPSVPPKNTPCFRRDQFDQIQQDSPTLLQRVAAKLHHDTEGERAGVLAYMVLLDRILEDRLISDDEIVMLADAAQNWGLSSSQLDAAHAQYVHNLAIFALADGVVTESERRDLEVTARLLGQDQSTFSKLLDSAATKLHTVSALESPRAASKEHELVAKSVCFTGELLATICGEPVTREVAELIASTAGCKVVSSVTKKLDVLVVADPETQSGKAKKARGYGIRILADSVFWKIVGARVD